MYAAVDFSEVCWVNPTL